MVCRPAAEHVRTAVGMIVQHTFQGQGGGTLDVHLKFMTAL